MAIAIGTEAPITLRPENGDSLAKEKDYFDVRGSMEAHDRRKQMYGLLGRPDDVELFVGPTSHGFSLERDEDLYCTPRGQVALLNSRTVFDFTSTRATELAGKRGKPRGDEVRQRVRRTLRLPKSDADTPPYARTLRRRGPRGYPTSQSTSYVVETEPGFHAVVYRLQNERLDSRPPRVEGTPAILYVSHHSADAELRDEPLVRETIKAHPDAVLYTVDVRGIGESRPDTCGENSFLSPYGCDYLYAIHSLMLDRPYLGGKTHDVIRTIDWLRSIGHGSIHVAALGWGTLPATFAGLFRDSVASLTLKRGLESYANIATTENYTWPLSSLLPNVLESSDLPDCRAELGKRIDVRMIESSSA